MDYSKSFDSFVFCCHLEPFLHKSTMTTYERFGLLDMFSFNFVNTDKLTETFRLSFYADYLTKWGEYAVIAKHYSSGTPMGYILGKIEGSEQNWHSHISAITVGEPFRKIGLARTLMTGFELTSKRQKAVFADLFVRHSNSVAVLMYENFGYSVYRRVLGYYSSYNKISEDALEMRKAVLGDCSCLKAPKDPVKPEELDCP